MRIAGLVLVLLLSPAAAGAAAKAAPAPPAVPPAAPPDSSVLMQGLLPKQDLGVLAFLKEHPTADGRGIVVAILDTGIDLDHPALQKTSTGEPKIIDVFDGTDNGRIELPVATTAGAAPLRGLTGRILHLPADLPVATPVRLGILLGHEDFPGGLTERRKRERVDDWRRARDRWQGSVTDTAGERNGALREALERITAKDGDPGDRFDVVALRRGDAWEVRIDTNGDGDLTNETPLHPFHEAREIARFPAPAKLSVALERIAPDASSIFLFFDEGAHGTHVAGIVGGYYGPGDPLNGLAPGVQFLAAKVGNGRMGGPTSHNSIMKGAQWAVDHGADVINISFGGSSFFEDGNEETPRFLNELVERTGVVICASAGNEGPALSTIGEPATARRIFAWGASISKLTQETNYGALDPRRDDLFQFSSRGPLYGGDTGVDFISPGAALSSLPTWGLVRGESWNGTSMASPQGAGFCALLLSACRQLGIPVTPDRLRRAMREGAERLPGIPAIEQGDGMPQALPALEACRRLATAYPARASAARTAHDQDAKRPVVGYVVTVANATGTGGGYYQRDLRAAEPFRVPFYVRPDFPSDSMQDARAAFLRIVRLTSEVPWMRAPLQQSIASDGAAILIEIDPAKLAPGLNAGRIVARDAAHPEAGIEFALPATVIRPSDVDPMKPILEGSWDLNRGDRRSAFVRVPYGASLARLRVREMISNPANSYEVALASPDLIRPSGDRVAGRRVDLASGEEARCEMHVLPGTVVEIVAFSRWHDNRPGRLSYRLEFSGVDVAAEPPVAIAPERPGAGLVLGAPPAGASVRFEGALDREEEPLEVEWRVHPDSLFPSPLNGLPSVVDDGEALLTTGADTVEIDLRFGPEFENVLDDGIYRIFDDSERIVAFGYLTSKPISFHPPHEGVYRVRFTAWARGPELFDGTRIVSPVVLRARKPVDLRVFRGAVGGFLKGPDSLDAVTLAGGERRRFFLRPDDPPGDKLLRGALRVIGQPDGALLATVPVVADTREPEPTTDERIHQAAEATIEEAEAATARSDAGELERSEIADELERVDHLRSAAPLLELKKGGGGEEEEEEEGGGDEAKPEATPSDDVWNLRVAALRLILRGKDAGPAAAKVEALRSILPQPNPENFPGMIEKKQKDAVVQELAAEVAYRKQDVKGARAALSAARDEVPDVEGGERLDLLLLAAEGKDAECRKAAERRLERHPDDREADEILVHSLVKLGWWDLAALRLAAWPERHPRAAQDLLRLWGEVDAARAKAPLPQSPLSAVAP